MVTYRSGKGSPEVLVYSIAQQAVWGGRFIDRYMSGQTPFPYAEFVDTDMLPSPFHDPVALKAAHWIFENARRCAGGGAVWLHAFDFVYLNGEEPVRAPWASAVSQANALIACLYWMKHDPGRDWAALARRAIIPFARRLNPKDGFATPVGGKGLWFQEYPTSNPARILNCHLLSLLALDKAARELNDKKARAAFDRGWLALKNNIGLYDRGDWSRYDIPNKLFIFLRLLPSETGQAVIGKITLRTGVGKTIRVLDPNNSEPSDAPVSRIAGIDWGATISCGGKAGRLIPNTRSKYSNGVPEGGTDQNTYILFEEPVKGETWIKNGLRMELEVFLEENASLALQFRDFRSDGLSFREDPSAPALAGDGWRKFQVNIPPRLIGSVLPRRYQRLHTELLGTLLDSHPDEHLQEIFEKWHMADFFDYGGPETGHDMPETVFAFVNDKCGLRCKMCDWGVKDEDAALTRHMTRKGGSLDKSILLNAARKTGGSIRGVQFSINGTEPFFYEKWFELLSGLKDSGSRIGLTSNGLLLHENASKLARLGLDALTISLDGPPELHDEIRGCPGLFERVMWGIKKFKAECGSLGTQIPQINVSFTISKYNHTRIMDFFESIRQAGPDCVILSHLNFVAPEVSREHNLRHPDFPIAPSSVAAWNASREMDFWALFWQIEEARKINWTKVCIIPYCQTPTRLKWYYTKPYLPMSRTRCFAPWYSMQVLADGAVSVLGRCFDFQVGDLKKESIKEVWNGSRYDKFRRFLLDSPLPAACMRCCGSL
ncbi:MAG: D-glucuronyl C5-epimerase family protein [Nitrospiraceae bacterium]|nr:D-glucuronyl C5-epimerase family protein [Nitrospiraceae bacterium]